MGHLGHLGHFSNIGYLRRPMKVIPLRRAWDMAMVFPGKAAHPGVGPRMHPRHGKFSSRSTAAVNPLFFDFNRLWLIPPLGTDGMKMSCAWRDVAVLMPMVMLFRCIGKACGCQVVRLSAPRLFLFFSAVPLCREAREGGVFSLAHTCSCGEASRGGLEILFFLFFQSNVRELDFFRRTCVNAGTPNRGMSWLPVWWPSRPPGTPTPLRKDQFNAQRSTEMPRQNH